MNEPRLDIDALAALEKRATPAPWTIRRDGHDSEHAVECGDHGHPGPFAGGKRRDGLDHCPTCRLIVGLRGAAPALIAAARERDQLDAALVDCNRLMQETCDAMAAKLAARDEEIAILKRWLLSISPGAALTRGEEDYGVEWVPGSNALPKPIGSAVREQAALVKELAEALREFVVEHDRPSCCVTSRCIHNEAPAGECLCSPARAALAKVPK